MSNTIEVLVGRIGKPHGIRGEVTVDVRTDVPELRFAAGARLDVKSPKGSAFGAKVLTVEKVRWHQGVLLAKFTELPDRNVAETARGVLLHAHVDAAASPEDPDEFYDHQLVGLTAYNLEGEEIGTVTKLLHGAQDLLQIRTPDRRDTLVPFVTQLVPEVDIAGGRVVIADRPGLVTPFEETGEPDPEQTQPRNPKQQR